MIKANQEKKASEMDSHHLLSIGDSFYTEASFKPYVFIQDEQTLVYAFNQETKLYKDVSRIGKVNYYLISNTELQQKIEKIVAEITDREME